MKLMIIMVALLVASCVSQQSKKPQDTKRYVSPLAEK